MEDVVLQDAFTVSQVNRYIKDRFAGDDNLRALTIKGEISNFVNHKKTGHFYFTLKDDAASIRAIMFKGNAAKLKFEPENGMNVVIRGSIQVFERDGAYQLYCETLEPDGIGALYVAFEQLKLRLEKEGLFDQSHKRALPAMPKKIGVVTAKTGAAIQDICNILSRRYPIGTVVVIPTLVQGEKAPASIVAGINAACLAGDIDLLIVGRGGGSMEDLWAFNDESVARAIYNSSIPVISAVGHEIDFTIADFVADLRAPTPSAAAELASPDLSAFPEQLALIHHRLYNLWAQRIKMTYERLKTNYAKLNLHSPMNRLQLSEEALLAQAARLNTSIDRITASKSELLVGLASTLDALSPLKVLTRGFTMTYSGKKLVRRVSDLKKGDRIDIRMEDGVVNAEVTDIIINNA